MIDNVFTAETALHRLRSRKYDWLVTHLTIEGTNGIDLVNNALKEKLIAPGRICIVTTLAKNTIIVRALREHGIHILRKPLSVKQIKDAIQLQ